MTVVPTTLRGGVPRVASGRHLLAGWRPADLAPVLAVVVAAAAGTTTTRIVAFLVALVVVARVVARRRAAASRAARMSRDGRSSPKVSGPEQRRCAAPSAHC